MFHRGGGGLRGLGDGPVGRENAAPSMLRSVNGLQRRLGSDLDENGPREAVKQGLRPRSALGNISSAQSQHTMAEPPLKVARIEKPEEVETMSRVATDPDFEPPCAAERLFEVIDSGSKPPPAPRPVQDKVPETPPEPDIEDATAFETPLTLLFEEDVLSPTGASE